MMMLVVLVGEVLADTITLDSGAALEGTLTHYEIRGTCNIHVDDGNLSGADVVLPCERLIRMERSIAAQTAAMPDGALLVVPDEQAPVEELAAVEEVAPVEELPPLVELAPMTVGEDLAGADVGTEPEAAPEVAIPAAPAPEEETPVAAVSPEEPVPVEEPEVKDPESAPAQKGPLGPITWPKIRIDR